MDITTAEDLKQFRAYKRLKTACEKLEAKAGIEGYSDEFYQQCKGYYRLIDMSEQEMIDQFRDDFKLFVEQYDQ